MSRPQHTPGPWFARPASASNRQWEVQALIPGTRRSYMLAELSAPWPQSERSPQAEADAHLIAAAPEMLRLLARAHDALLLASLFYESGKDTPNGRLRQDIDRMATRLGGFPEYADPAPLR